MSSSPLNLAAPVIAAPGGGLSEAFARVGAVDTRMLVGLRCVLALSGLLIAWLLLADAWERTAWIYGFLAFYCLFSVYLFYDSYRFDWPPVPRYIHWIDIVSYGYLIAVTGGGGSFFFLFFFFPILASSFSWGFREGLMTTVASTALFIGMELLFVPAGRADGIDLSPIYAFYLFIFGFMIAYLGGYERLLTRRLALLKEINSPWNPRFGVDHVNGINLDRVREFYEGTSCVLMLRRPDPASQHVMYVSFSDKPGYSRTQSRVDDNAAEALLRLPETLAAYYHVPESPWWVRLRGYAAYDFGQKKRTRNHEQECAGLANLLDGRAFVTVPYSQHDGTTGRLFLTTDREGFDYSDIEFLVQVSDAMATVIENMYLVEELITKAAEHERLAISRDLHDTTIQPYIGLKLALDALHREAGEHNALSGRIAELIAMTEMTVRDLRSYAATFKENVPMPGQFLVEAVKHQAERLERFYSIRVETISYISPLLSGRLAAEAFQIISEGLSNIMRHTSAKNAYVSILCEDSNLLLQIGNEAPPGAPGSADFKPRSIAERVQALKGKILVETRADGYTVIHVTIPM